MVLTFFSSNSIGVSMPKLRVASAAVVEDLEVLEDRVREFDTGPSATWPVAAPATAMTPTATGRARPRRRASSAMCSRSARASMASTSSARFVPRKPAAPTTGPPPGPTTSTGTRRRWSKTRWRTRPVASSRPAAGSLTPTRRRTSRCRRLECPRFGGHLRAWSAVSGRAGRIVRYATGIESSEAVSVGVSA